VAHWRRGTRRHEGKAVVEMSIPSCVGQWRQTRASGWKGGQDFFSSSFFLVVEKIDQKPKRWHSVLNEALWAYRMTPHGATKTSPYELVYGHHAVLPWEM
jgi:hypothetical protein